MKQIFASIVLVVLSMYSYSSLLSLPICTLQSATFFFKTSHQFIFQNLQILYRPVCCFPCLAFYFVICCCPGSLIFCLKTHFYFSLVSKNGVFLFYLSHSFCRHTRINRCRYTIRLSDGEFLLQRSMNTSIVGDAVSSCTQRQGVFCAGHTGLFRRNLP